MHKILFYASVIGLGFGCRMASAASAEFTSRELFRIPFGTSPETLGARIEGGNFIFPRDFTMDEAGHFFIYDSNKHRIARFSATGKYEMQFSYLETAQQIFAHADSHQNVWLLLSDLSKGVYYGIYDAAGRRMKSGVFSQFDHFRLHPNDDYTLHVLLSSRKNPEAFQAYILDDESLRMKRVIIARPPENHHQVRTTGRTYFIDQVPDGSKDNSHHVSRVTDQAHHNIADIQGSVVYMTGRGEIYTRVGEREIDVYDIQGSLKGKVNLEGLSSACASIRFDSYGNIYELDGIPDADLEYSSHMTGMRVIQWERR